MSDTNFISTWLNGLLLIFTQRLAHKSFACSCSASWPEAQTLRSEKPIWTLCQRYELETFFDSLCFSHPHFSSLFFRSKLLFIGRTLTHPNSETAPCLDCFLNSLGNTSQLFSTLMRLTPFPGLFLYEYKLVTKSLLGALANSTYTSCLKAVRSILATKVERESPRSSTKQMNTV